MAAVDPLLGALTTTCRNRQRQLLQLVEDEGTLSQDALVEAIDGTSCPAGHPLHLAALIGGMLQPEADGRVGLGRAGSEWLHEGGRPSPSWQASVAPGVPPLRQWQVEALRAWCDHGRHGVVEAVTGTGKSRVGIEATREALADDYNVVVMVPTVDLVAQWVKTLRQNHVPAVGALGDGQRASFMTHRVIVGTVQSLHPAPPTRVDGKVLLVADECHRYGAIQWSRALHPSYRRRLGLTATFERNDDGINSLLSYFGGSPVFKIGFPRAIADGVVARYNVKLLGVPLTHRERADYDEADRTAKDTRLQLLASDFPAEPFGAFLHEVTKAAEDPFEDPTIADVARRYLKAFSQRIDVMTRAQAKLDVARHLAPQINGSRGAIVFTRRVEMAEEIASTLRDAAVQAEAIHSESSRAERQDRLTRLKVGALKALVAPTILDEGIDVPDIDLAIVMGGSRSRRQMIQRMGRVLRLKADGRRATFVVVYAEGTAEDLSQTDGAEGCLDLIVESADSVEPLILDSGKIAPSPLVCVRPQATSDEEPSPIMSAEDASSEVALDAWRPTDVDPERLTLPRSVLEQYTQAHGVEGIAADAALRRMLRDFQELARVTRSGRTTGAYVLRHAAFVLVITRERFVRYASERGDALTWEEVGRPPATTSTGTGDDQSPAPVAKAGRAALSRPTEDAEAAERGRSVLDDGDIIGLIDPSSISIDMSAVRAASRAFGLGDPFTEEALEETRRILTADLDEAPLIESIFGRLAVHGRRATWTISRDGHAVLSMKPTGLVDEAPRRGQGMAGRDQPVPVEAQPLPEPDDPLDEDADAARPEADNDVEVVRDIVERIERLASLRQAGLLTDAEFTAAKAKILF